MNVPDAAAELHEGTKHTWARILAESQGRDWGNHPLPFKIYPDLQPLWLPRELPESSVPATEVLAGHVSAPTSALDLAGLARLLFFSAGVTRFLQGVLFRAAPSAGAETGTSGPAWPGPPRSRPSRGCRCAWCSRASPGGRPGSTVSVATATYSGTRARSWPTCWRWPPRPAGARTCCSALWTRRSRAWSASASQRSTRLRW